jgi:hypothetical protein
MATGTTVLSVAATTAALREWLCVALRAATVARTSISAAVRHVFTVPFFSAAATTNAAFLQRLWEQQWIFAIANERRLFAAATASSASFVAAHAELAAAAAATSISSASSSCFVFVLACFSTNSDVCPSVLLARGIHIDDAVAALVLQHQPQ